MKIIKWGIIGCGKIASKFASDFQFISGAHVEAVASRTDLKAQTFSREHNIPRYFGSYEALLEDADIDAVYIATPHSFHCQNSLAALDHDKAVLCEKPLAMHLGEAQEMANKAKKRKKLLMEGMWTAFLPHYQFVLKQLQEHKFGKLKELRADFGFSADPDPQSRFCNTALGGGSLLDIGIYPVYAALSTLGNPESIEASAEFFETGADKSCRISFDYKGGIKAQLSSSLIEHTPTEAIFICEKGSIKINSRFHEPTSVELFDGIERKTVAFSTEGLGYHYEIEHFNALLRANKTESPIMSLITSMALTSLLDRIRSQIGLHYTKKHG